MKILALDLATQTGYAHSHGPSGSVNFDLIRGESPGMRFLKFRKWLVEFLKEYETTLVVYEQAGHHRSRAAEHVCHGFIATCELVIAEFQNIELTNRTSSAIKKHALGEGVPRARSGKPFMVQAADNMFPDIVVIDDNHADSLLLLDMVKKEFHVE